MSPLQDPSWGQTCRVPPLDFEATSRLVARGQQEEGFAVSSLRSTLVLAFIVSRVVQAQLLSRFQLCVTPWTVVFQAPLFMGLSRQKYWSGSPFSPAGDLLSPGIKPMSPASPASAGRFFTIVLSGKPCQQSHLCSNSVLS